jgi:hypothetical protein
MGSEAELVADLVEKLRPRLRRSDFELIHWRDIDPGRFSASDTWADKIGRTGHESVELVIVLLGERIGTPTPAQFRLRQVMRKKLDSHGLDWIKINGVDADFEATLQNSNSVPLTGTLFELLDAILSEEPNHLGSHRPHILVAFFGRRGAKGNTINPGLRRHLNLIVKEYADDQERLEKAQADYHQQVAWLQRIWKHLQTQRQLPIYFFETQTQLEELVENAIDESLGLKPYDPFETKLPGLGPYTATDSNLFFGRAATARLISDTAKYPSEDAPPLLIVTGASGAGKSSLLGAGLIGPIQRSSQAGRGYVGVMQTAFALAQGPNPVARLAVALIEGAQAGGQMNLARALGSIDAAVQRMENTSTASQRFVQWLGEGLDALKLPNDAKPYKVVIVIDQCEQILASYAEQDEAMAGWQALLHLLHGLVAAAPINGVAAAGAQPEWFAEAQSYFQGRVQFSMVFGVVQERLDVLRELLAVTRNPISVAAALDQDDYALIARDTFAAMGLDLAPDFIEDLASQATELSTSQLLEEGGDPSSPVLPLFAVTLKAIHETWLKSAYAAGVHSTSIPGRMRLEREIFAHVARVKNAIAALGEATWKSVYGTASSKGRARMFDAEMSTNPFDEALFARLMRRLVTIAQTPSGISKRLLVVMRLDDPVAQRMRPLLEALRLVYLVMLEAVQGSSEGVRLVHEAVLDEWGRAHDWLKSESRHLRTITQVADRMEKWERSGRDPRLLFHDEVDLTPAAELLFSWQDDLPIRYPGANAFVVRSLGAAFPFGADASQVLQTCTYHAAGTGAVELIRDLLAKDSSLARAADGNGGSLIIVAAEQGHANIVEALLEAHADPNHP